MQFSLLAASAVVGLVAAQGSPTTLLPPSMASGCASTYNDGAPFQIGILNASAATMSKMKRQATNPNSMPGNTLMLTLNNGQLKDTTGRFGYIASNNQLQFDNPIQSNALYTAGFSACPNGTLALESALFYECLTTFNGTSFYNLYDESIGSQCLGAFIMIIGAKAPVSSTTTGSLTTSSLTSTVTPITVLTDGQPQASTSGMTIISAVTNGMSTPMVISGIASATIPAIMSGTVSVISQITDGQVQAPTNATTLMPFLGAASHSLSGSAALIFSAVVAGAISLGALLL